MSSLLTIPSPRKFQARLSALLLLVAGLCGLPAVAAWIPAPHRTRLYLKDGSYQVVMSYRTVGSNVLYVSAERGGVEEVVPARLVDFDATEQWEQRHPAVDPDAPQASAPAPAIDPELLKEEADRAAYTPEVASDLSLPEQDSVLALDTFHGTPELIPMPQSSGDLNRNTAHNILPGAINPMAASHAVVQLKGLRSPVQLHVPDPTFYIRVGDGPPSGTGTALTVDTHGAAGAAPAASAGGASTSRYVILRADVRTDARVFSSFHPALLADSRREEDVFPAVSTLLPGGHWMKLTLREPLLFGEYALLEVVNERQINLGVWDFGIHPVAPENRDAMTPEPKRPYSLERRRPE